MTIKRALLSELEVAAAEITKISVSRGANQSSFLGSINPTNSWFSVTMSARGRHVPIVVGFLISEGYAEAEVKKLARFSEVHDIQFHGRG